MKFKILSAIVIVLILVTVLFASNEKYQYSNLQDDFISPEEISSLIARFGIDPTQQYLKNQNQERSIEDLKKIESGDFSNLSKLKYSEQEIPSMVSRYGVEKTLNHLNNQGYNYSIADLNKIKIEQDRIKREEEKRLAEEEKRLAPKFKGKSILLGFDWVYPNMTNPTAAWKFSKDGSFNFSTTVLGGGSKTGTWRDIDNNQIKLSYTDGSESTLTITSESTFEAGSTTYKKY